MKKQNRPNTEQYDTHWSNERAYKKGYAEGFANGVKQFAEKLKTALKGLIGLNYIDRMAEELVSADKQPKGD